MDDDPPDLSWQAVALEHNGEKLSAEAIKVFKVAIDRGEIAAAVALARDGPADHARLNVFRGRLALQGNDARQAATYFRAALHQDREDRDARG